jgi:hypothetical protein
MTVLNHRCFNIKIRPLLSPLLLKGHSHVKVFAYLHSGVNDFAVHVTAVSMTPLCMSQWSQWLHCASHSCVTDSAELVSKFASLHSGVNDSAVHTTAVSMTLLCTPQQCQWLCCARHSGVNDSAMQVTAVSMTHLCNKLFQVSRWKSHVRVPFTSSLIEQ